MSERKTICANCRYWDGYREKKIKKKGTLHISRGDIKRLCRRFPPQVIAGRDNADWPLTGWFWFCGEFQH